MWNLYIQPQLYVTYFSNFIVARREYIAMISPNESSLISPLQFIADWIYHGGRNKRGIWTLVRSLLVFSGENRRAAFRFAKQASLESGYPSPQAFLPPSSRDPVFPLVFAWECVSPSLLACANGPWVRKSFIIARRISPPGSRHKGSFIHTPVVARGMER